LSSHLHGRRGRLALALVGALASIAPAAGLFVPGKDRHPDGRADLYVREPLPCDQPVQTLLLAPAEQYAFADTTTGASVVAGYACEPGWLEAGPEHVYELTCADDLILDAWLAGNAPDLDLILLGACDTDSCLVQANTELSGQLSAGRTYYLVVDGYGEAAGPYELTLETRHVGLADEICADGGAVPVDVVEPGTGEFTDNLFGAANLVSIFDCAPLTVRGGEVWYAFTMAAADTDTVGAGFRQYLRIDLSANPDADNLDLAFWIFDACGPDAECLAFVDDEPAGGNETLRWINLDPEVRTVYLAVDCLRPPSEELGGGYSLSFNAIVPVERRTLSDVRRLFR